MAISLADLKRNTRQLPVEYLGITINVTYKPGAITPTFGRDLAPGDSVMVQLLAKSLVSWDIFQDDALTVPLPITVDTLGDLGSGLLNAIIQAITLDSMVGKVHGATSDAGSSPRAS